MSEPVCRGQRLRRRARRLVSLFVAASMCLAAPAHAANVLWVGGTSGSLGQLVPAGTFGTTDELLGGAFQDDPISTVEYPGSIWPITGLVDPTLGRSVNTGVTELEDLAANTPGSLVVVGTSQGALVVQQAAADLNDDPGVPSDTTFILIADPNLGLLRGLHGVHLPILDYTPAALPETRFDTIVVINQYDGIADPIARPWNLLTDLNALMGIAYVHPFAHNADLTTVPADNITVTTNDQQGTTTIYRVPTEQLPLTTPLRQLGVPAEIVDHIDGTLRPIVDKGYDPLGDEFSPGKPSISTAQVRGVASRRESSSTPAQPVRSSASATRPPRTGHTRRPGVMVPGSEDQSPDFVHSGRKPHRPAPHHPHTEPD